MRRNSFFLLTLVALSITYSFHFQAQAAPPGPLIKHLSSLLKWTRSYSSSKAPQTDENVVQFENGYLVETVVEGNDIGVVPYKIGVSEDGELFAVDSINSKVVRVTPPLSQYSRARLIAGSFQGYTGHVDGKPSEARFNHPKGVTMDDQGNIYVADTLNLAIRKISDSGVTTIAGGKSNVAGYTDGPSEDAKFSNDFDVVYVRPTCSLLVIDRGNAALRQIPLGVEDCNYQYNSISLIDVLMVLGAVVIGYAMCMLQQGLGPSSPKSPSEHESKGKPSQEKPTIRFADPTKEEPGWPSFGQLVIDLSKIGAEVLGGMFFYFVPSRLSPKKGLTPFKDSLRMPEDHRPASVQRHVANPPPVSEARHVHGPNPSNKYSENAKPTKMKSSSFKDRPSKRHDYAEFYGAGGEAPPLAGRSKSQKERTRHRQREKSGEVCFASEQKPKSKPVEPKPVDYDNPKFDHYNMRNSRYGPDDSFRF